MLRPTAVAAALTALLATTDAFRYNADAGTVALDFYRSTENVRPAGARLAKRQGKSVGESISWGGLLYYINVTLGTPGQPAAAWLDTGSSDLWLPDTGSDICQQSQAGCSSNGGFNPKKSSSYKTIARDQFEIQYASGDDIMGDYGQDTLQMDQAKIPDMIFGLASTGQTTTPLSGIMGIGYTLGESVAAQGTTYPNIIDRLVSNGIISTKTYSLYLNELRKFVHTLAVGCMLIRSQSTATARSCSAAWTRISTPAPSAL
jgi:Eukaryotic aspartyl protease